MPGGEDEIKIDIIAVLGGLSIVVEDLLEKEVREVIIILV
jgi:hypothetical protein